MLTTSANSEIKVWYRVGDRRQPRDDDRVKVSHDWQAHFLVTFGTHADGNAAVRVAYEGPTALELGERCELCCLLVPLDVFAPRDFPSHN